MQFGLIAVSSTGGAALLARAALIVVMVCCLAAPLVNRVWSLRARPGSEDPVDLDALWQRYKRGEVQGRRGLVGTRAKSLKESTSDDSPSY
jgi:hypothetical protein